MIRPLAIAAALMVPFAAHAQAPGPVLTVEGVQSMRALPDRAELKLEASVEGRTAEESRNMAVDRQHEILNWLKDAGVATDVVAFSPAMNEVYDEDVDFRGTVLRRALRGFMTRIGVVVNTMEPGKVGKLVERAYDRKDLKVVAVRFELGGKEDWSNLRKAAIANALKQAKADVQALGGRLGPIVDFGPVTISMDEDVAEPGAPRKPFQGHESYGASLPVAPAERTVTARATVKWEIRPATD